MTRRIGKVLCAGVLVWGGLAVPLRAQGDNPPLGDSVGAIEGDSISIEGPMSVEVVHGQARTVLRSGSDVRVRAGQARIKLVEGGEILICGSAHFSVLKSGGALTLALEGGIIHAHVENDLALTVYTPQIQARPISIGNGPEDVLVGLDSVGAMCIRANKGAVRLEQQLTGQSVLVPQNGDVSLSNGQLESLRTAAGSCTCEEQAAAIPAQAATEVSVLASPEGIKKVAEERKADSPPATAPPPVEKPEPVYQVFMPPLRYDANAKVQPDYDPSLIVLVRRVRVRSALIFQGKVEGDPVVARATTPPPPPPAQRKPAAAQKPAADSAWNRMKTYWRKLWSPSS
ncbi:MAG TPA: hypothetical protein VJY15_11790 [Candidatus Acidoferrum sp.]|nr:hypothetical protein [Candidatus Acidoferrum sp.]